MTIVPYKASHLIFYFKRIISDIGNVNIGKNKDILDAELWEISEALDIAKKKASVGNTPIEVFCDSQKALKAIALPLTCQENRPVLEKSDIPKGWRTST